MENNEYKEVVVDVFGDYAMFSPPYSGADKVSYPVPTPSAMRNLLCAIYFKPTEFYYQITQIDVIKQGRSISIRKNEIKQKVDVKKLLKGEDVTIYLGDRKFDRNRGQRTQRTYVYLKDVYYRVHAKIVLKKDREDRVDIVSITNQFYQRLSKGKCFHQPFFGTRECMAFFAKPNYLLNPINESKDYGIMLYDVFDPRNNVPIDSSYIDEKPNVKFYFCTMVNGVIKVPPIDSKEFLQYVE